MQYIVLKSPSYVPDNKDSDFFELIYPILKDVDDLYWLIDLQAGPVNPFWAYETNNEEMIDDNIISAAPFTSTSATLHKPGMITKYGRHLIDDETSYYIGLEADSDEIAVKKAAAIFNRKYYGIENQDFIKAFKVNGVIYARYIWWRSTGLMWDVIFNGKYDLIQPFLEYHKKSEMLITISEIN